MDKSYLFFDIECANCFNGVGKMCSLGYVVVNEEFEILDEDDVVMNPETEFDWYLFAPKKDCQLAYSKDYFRMQHNFESYYSPIKKLFEEAGRKILGFSVSNDIGFLQSACERYNLPGINYAAYDIRKILSSSVGKDQKLEDWAETFNISLKNLKMHKSVDDAKLSMLVLKSLCEQKNISIEDLIQKNKEFKISVEKYIEQRENKRHTDEILEKIKYLYEKKIKSPYSKRFVGENFAFAYKIKYENVDISLEVAEKIFKHGGILHKNLKSNGTLIVLDLNLTDEQKESYKKRKIRILSVDEILE